MRKFRFCRIRQRLKQFQKLFYPKALILLYHRIAEQDLDPWSLAVTPQCFREHLEVLNKRAYPMSLKELAQAHQDGKIPNRAVVITFDDGYANNLYAAKPLLEDYSIPATVFILSGYLEKQREFWWDELEQLLLSPGQLPETLNLKIEGNHHYWNLGAAVSYSAEDYQRDRQLQAWKAQPGSRLYFYHSVWQTLQPLPEALRQKILDELITWAKIKPSIRPSHRPLTPTEVCTLEQGDLIEVGAHTVNHPLLFAHSLEIQHQEIQNSKVDLEKILGHNVTSFAYPFGAYRQETVPLVQATGFNCACATTEETAWPKSDRFQLPRFEVQNWDRTEFEQRLGQWFQH